MFDNRYSTNSAIRLRTGKTKQCCILHVLPIYKSASTETFMANDFGTQTIKGFLTINFISTKFCRGVLARRDTDRFREFCKINDDI